MTPPPPPERLRPARPEEAPLLAALVERAYGPWVPLVGRRPMPMDDDYAARIAAGEALVLERDGDGAVVGLLVLVDAPDHLWLDNVAVEPGLHGQGIGRALMGLVEAEARRRGRPEVRLLTNARMARNIALYARLGYRETDRQGDEGFRRVFMAKRVD